MSETNTNVAVETVKLTREQKLAKQIDTLKSRIAADTVKVNELVAEYNNIAALAVIGVGTGVVVKLGRKFADKDTTRFENAVVVGVKEEEDGSKLYKVSYGSGFEADLATVTGAALSLPTVPEAPVAAE